MLMSSSIASYDHPLECIACGSRSEVVMSNLRHGSRSASQWVCRVMGVSHAELLGGWGGGRGETSGNTSPRSSVRGTAELHLHCKSSLVAFAVAVSQCCLYHASACCRSSVDPGKSGFMLASVQCLAGQGAKLCWPHSKQLWATRHVLSIFRC